MGKKNKKGKSDDSKEESKGQGSQPSGSGTQPGSSGDKNKETGQQQKQGQGKQNQNPQGNQSQQQPRPPQQKAQGGQQQPQGPSQQQAKGGQQQQRGPFIPPQQQQGPPQQQWGPAQQQKQGGPQQQQGPPQKQWGPPQQQQGPPQPQWGPPQQQKGPPQQQKGPPQQQKGPPQQQKGPPQQQPQGGQPPQQGPPQKQWGPPQQQSQGGQQQQWGPPKQQQGPPRQQYQGGQQQGGWGKENQQQRGQSSQQQGGNQQRGPYQQQRQGDGQQRQQYGDRGRDDSRSSGGSTQQYQGQQRGPPHQSGGGKGYQKGDQGGQRRYEQPTGGYKQDNTIVRVPAPPQNGVKRGTLGDKFELETNYLLLNLDKMPDTAYHYDVKIDPDRPKKFVRSAFEEYVRKVFPNHELAYDGKASAYSCALLPEDKLGSEIEVKVCEESREIPFKVTLKATVDIEIDLKSLKGASYHKERIFDKPMRALQCIEVVLSTFCHKEGVRAGRSFFKKPREQISLGDGFELWLGLYQAAMLCDQPLLNVDVSHKSFPSQVNLVQYWDNLRNKNSYALTDFLKGLRVNYKPPACFKSTERGYKFIKVMDSSQKQTFKDESGKTLTIQQYFRSKGFELQRPELPCLHVGSTVKNIYLPLELLDVPSGQAIMRKDNENQVRQMIRFAATSTDQRKAKIMDLLQQFQFYQHPTVERFGISVGRNFITVAARLLKPPKIEYSGGKVTIDRPGEWRNNYRFLKCDNKTIHKWAIINISQKREISRIFLEENFISKIGREAKKLGMSLDSACNEIKEIQGGRGAISIVSELVKLKKNKISIVFVILPFASESYAKVKQEAELSCGIVTQCIKGDTMFSTNFRGQKIIDQMTIGNILLKVNAKLNGTNHRIDPMSEIKLQQKKVMFVGADVSHPSPLQTNLPSIVGVVASHDLYGTQYNMQYRLQAAKLEEIDDMKTIFTQHLKMFQTSTGSFPDHVIYYRDGVSDGQFPKIERIEVGAMRAACKELKCNAKFTVIIVVKRHHTRFFPKSNDGEGKFNNVKAGTVVDQTICHPNETQFFLCSHKAIQGTSKPTRYNVIIDDAKIDIDDLQSLTYNLCHLFPRCNRSVSYPAPAYLAHLVGLRGRAYIEGAPLNLENLKAEYNKRLVSNDVMKFNPMYFV